MQKEYSVKFSDIKKREDDEKLILEQEEHQLVHFIDSDPSKLKLEAGEQEKIEEIKDKTKKQIQITPTTKGIDVSSERYVGNAEFANFIVTVQPKFTNFNNLGNMIRFCYLKDFKDRLLFDLNKIRFHEGSNDLLEVIILIFLESCSNMLKKGLFRSYVTDNKNTPFLKGKLIIKKQILNAMKFNMKFNCEYDEFTANNLENQIILHTLQKCQMLTTQPDTKKWVRKLIHRIDKEVEDKHIFKDDFKRISYNRLNKHYQDPHELCKLILDNISMYNLRKQQKKFIVPFFIDMANIFELFVHKLLKEYNPPVAYHKRPIGWEKKLSAGNKVLDNKVIEPDFLTYKGYLSDVDDIPNDVLDSISILDSKYMQQISDSEMYQFAFYMHHFKKKTAIAILPTEKPTIDDHGRYVDTEAHNWTGKKQDITIKVRHINIDEILEKIYSRDKSNLDVVMKEIITEIAPITV